MEGSIKHFVMYNSWPIKVYSTGRLVVHYKLRTKYVLCGRIDLTLEKYNYQ